MANGNKQRIISSADIIEDIIRLIPPSERAAFRDMLVHETRGRVLPDGELRRVAERTWHKFLRYGWPMHGPRDVASVLNSTTTTTDPASVGPFLLRFLERLNQLWAATESRAPARRRGLRGNDS